MTIVPRTGPFSASSALLQDVLVPAGEVVGAGGEDRSLRHVGRVARPIRARACVRCPQIRSEIFPTSSAGISSENPSRFVSYGDRRARAPRPAPRSRDRGRAAPGSRTASAGSSPGEIDDDAFRVFRLNQGIYGQRQGGHNQMLRVKIPYGKVEPDQLEMLALHRRDLLARLGPPHHPPERPVPLRAARGHRRGAAPARVGRTHEPRGVRRHRPQRGGLPPRRRVPLRGARHQPVGRGHQGPLPAQPDRAAPAPQVQDQLLGLRHRLRPGDVQRRRRRSRCNRPAPRRHRRARVPGVHGRRPRRQPAPGAGARGVHLPRGPAAHHRGDPAGRRTTTATATTSCAPA